MKADFILKVWIVETLCEFWVTSSLKLIYWLDYLHFSSCVKPPTLSMKCFLLRMFCISVLVQRYMEISTSSGIQKQYQIVT